MGAFAQLQPRAALDHADRRHTAPAEQFAGHSRILHPTPAVGGHERRQALEHIRRFEGFDRGWYAAPLGWLDAQGNGEFIVGLRSALLNGNQARLFDGCGIVEHSDPASEYDETCIKLADMRAALQV